MTTEEYLALDRAAEFRSEFLDGEIITMSGGSARHSRLKVRLVSEVYAALRGTSYEVFDSDRGVKLRRYREIESLQDYILVAQDEIRIEQYTRRDANTWTLRDYLHAEEVLGIASIGVSVPLSAIYERIEFRPE